MRSAPSAVFRGAPAPPETPLRPPLTPLQATTNILPGLPRSARSAVYHAGTVMGTGHAGTVMGTSHAGTVMGTGDADAVMGTSQTGTFMSTS